MKRLALGLAGLILTTRVMAADIGGEPEACAASAGATKAEILAALGSGEIWAAADGGTPALVVWRNEGVPSAIKLVYAGADGTWHGAAIAENSSLVGAFLSRQGGVALFSMWSSGGPGPSYKLTLAGKDFASPHCATVEFPEALNKPDWANQFLDLLDFNGQAGGAVSLATAVANDDEKKVPFSHYVYRSADGGNSWMAPEGLNAAPPALTGDFVPLAKVTSADQLKSLPDRID